jgi:hypothetical protein
MAAPGRARSAATLRNSRLNSASRGNRIAEPGTDPSFVFSQAVAPLCGARNRDCAQGAVLGNLSPHRNFSPSPEMSCRPRRQPGGASANRDPWHPRNPLPGLPRACPGNSNTRQPGGAFANHCPFAPLVFSKTAALLRGASGRRPPARPKQPRAQPASLRSRSARCHPRDRTRTISPSTPAAMPGPHRRRRPRSRRLGRPVRRPARRRPAPRRQQRRLRPAAPRAGRLLPHDGRAPPRRRGRLVRVVAAAGGRRQDRRRRRRRGGGAGGGGRRGRRRGDRGAPGLAWLLPGQAGGRPGRRFRGCQGSRLAESALRAFSRSPLTARRLSDSTAPPCPLNLHCGRPAGPLSGPSREPCDCTRDRSPSPWPHAGTKAPVILHTHAREPKM